MKEEVCINCLHVERNSLGQYSCKLTNIPVTFNASCEGFEGREPEAKKRRTPSYLLLVIICIALFALPYYRKLVKTNNYNDAVAQRKYFAKQLRERIYFEGFHSAEHKNTYPRIRAVYFTQDSLCTIEKFEGAALQQIYSLPDTLTADTVYLEHILEYKTSNDSRIVLQQLIGYSIKQYVNRRYVSID